MRQLDSAGFASCVYDMQRVHACGLIQACTRVWSYTGVYTRVVLYRRVHAGGLIQACTRGWSYTAVYV